MVKKLEGAGPAASGGAAQTWALQGGRRRHRVGRLQPRCIPTATVLPMLNRHWKGEPCSHLKGTAAGSTMQMRPKMGKRSSGTKILEL